MFFPHLGKRIKTVVVYSFVKIDDVILHHSSYYSSLKGFLYYSNPTKDSLLLLSHRISLLFRSGRGFFAISLSKDSLLFRSGKGFFIIPLPEDFFTIPVRQRILYYFSLKGFLYYSSLKGFLYYSSLKGFLYYTSPTKDSLLLLSQRISLLFQSGKGFFTI